MLLLIIIITVCLCTIRHYVTHIFMIRVLELEIWCLLLMDFLKGKYFSAGSQDGHKQLSTIEISYELQGTLHVQKNIMVSPQSQSPPFAAYIHLVWQSHWLLLIRIIANFKSQISWHLIDCLIFILIHVFSEWECGISKLLWESVNFSFSLFYFL